MVVIVALAIFVLLIFFTKKRIGPALLAMVAGLTIYSQFGEGISEWILKLFDGGADLELIQMAVYVAMVAAFPIILYLRSDGVGLGGLVRVAETAVFSVILVSLISAPLAYFFPFDSLALDISGFIEGIKGPISLVGVLMAYFDILVYR
jgi:hypothetical protein